MALLLAPPDRDEVDGLRRAVGDPGLGRVPAHLTLVPPVNVRLDDLSRALAVLRAAAAAAPEDLTLELGPPATFLPVNPVLYLPVGGAVEALQRLRDAVFQAPLARTLTWPFVPHVTLADGGDPAVLAAAPAVLAGYRTAVEFDRVHLLQEVRGEAGREWRPLADVCFGPAVVVARDGPLALTLTRSGLVDPEAQHLLAAEGVELELAGPSPEAQPPREMAVVTARREGAVVGVGAVWLTGDGHRRVALLVATEHRRQGIGGHLVRALEAEAQREGWAAWAAPALRAALRDHETTIRRGPTSTC